jgi:hypothetical protein
VERLEEVIREGFEKLAAAAEGQRAATAAQTQVLREAMASMRWYGNILLKGRREESSGGMMEEDYQNGLADDSQDDSWREESAMETGDEESGEKVEEKVERDAEKEAGVANEMFGAAPLTQ